ncbi:MAG: hypothetical protein J6X33_04075 [Clostridiales bacterium]|nr:hypothetical protein [Clostridiales bacterium]
MDDNNFMNNDQQYQTAPSQPQQFVQPGQAQQYQQPPYQQPQYQPQPQQFMAQQPAYWQTTPQVRAEAEDPASRKKKANILCFISLGLSFVPYFMSFLMILMGEFSDVSKYKSSDFLIDIMVSLMGASYIASWVLMIIARVKFKESVFAKILMWVYIGMAALGVIAVMAFIAWCVSQCSNMPG